MRDDNGSDRGGHQPVAGLSDAHVKAATSLAGDAALRPRGSTRKVKVGLRGAEHSRFGVLAFPEDRVVVNEALHLMT